MSPQDLMPSIQLGACRDEDDGASRQSVTTVPVAIMQEGHGLDPYVAVVPALPSCRGIGWTAEDAICRVREEIEKLLARFAADQAPLPFEEPKEDLPDSQVQLVEVAIPRRIEG